MNKQIKIHNEFVNKCENCEENPPTNKLEWDEFSEDLQEELKLLSPPPDSHIGIFICNNFPDCNWKIDVELQG